jgi:hypothetical protein
MRASPQLLIIEAAVGLFEERLEADPRTSRPDLLALGRELHRLNGLYIRLVEKTTAKGGPKTSPPLN